ncbi:MAG: hypothetical protein ACRC8S_21410 [Fimbriiglobus sp.]
MQMLVIVKKRGKHVVSMKRIDQDNTEVGGGAVQTIPVDYQAFRLAAMNSSNESAHAKEDRFAMWWRIFGGTILSILALGGVTIYNNLANNITELRADLNRANTDLRAEVAKSNEARAELIRKDEFNLRMTTVWDGIKTMQTQGNAQTGTVTGYRTELDGLKERLTRMTADFDSMKKDQSIITDTLKKDISSLEVFKDKLQMMVQELKASRDELTKMRGELDRNQAHDQERKESRDKQMKQYDESVKEMQKTLQEVREKIARLEGQSKPKTD